MAALKKNVSLYVIMKKRVVSHIIFLIFATFYSFPLRAAEPVDTILHRAMNAAE